MRDRRVRRQEADRRINRILKRGTMLHADIAMMAPVDGQAAGSLDPRGSSARRSA